MGAMAVDWQIMAIAVPAVLLAGISKGGFGSGASFAAAAILALVVDPILALGVMLPLLMLIDAVTLRSFWGGWHRPSAIALMVGSLPGVALGAWLSQVTDPDVPRFLIGAISLAFVVWEVGRDRGWIRVPALKFRWSTGLAVGVVAGFTSFVSHAGGPPVGIYLLAQRLDKTVYHATTVVTFWAVNIAKLIPYTFLGFFTAESLVLNIWLAPVAVMGAVIGIRAHHLLPERAFFAVTYVLLVLTGSKLIWDALT